MVRMNFIFNSINLAAEEKTKRKNILYRHESEGNTKIKLKKKSLLFFFSIFNKLGREGL